MAPEVDAVTVAVVAKVGLLPNRGIVQTPAGRFEVRPSDAGGYIVEAPPGQEPGVVRYYTDQKILEIQRPGVSVVIAFRPETEHTTFCFGGRTYDLASMELGTVEIAEGDRAAVRGNLTSSGVRLSTVSSDLQPIERELAFGLALRIGWLEE